MVKSWKEWEKPLIELEDNLRKLKDLAARENDPTKKKGYETQITGYEGRRDKYIDVKYSRLSPWEEVLVARAEPRPYTLDYIAALFTDFVELDGDRRAGADHAIVAGPACFDGRPVMVCGHQKGRNIQDRAYRNFGMSKPEGYRKAMRMFDMAERFRLPVITFIDTPAADPGVESESRGISEAIAASTMKMFALTVPIVSVVIGEGGSGGAIGIAAANKVLMQSHSVYSVIPPEGCAAILWRDAEQGPQAAASLRLTANSALDLGLVDEILSEPFGAAHRDPAGAADLVREGIARHLNLLLKMSPVQLKDQRYDRFRALGKVVTI